MVMKITDGERLYADNFNVFANIGKNGVSSGCAVTENTTPDMSVNVASGSVIIGGSTVSVTGGNVAISASDPSFDRFDLIVVDNTGAVSVVAGTPASDPKPNDSIDFSQYTVLARVRVRNTTTQILNSDIEDMRVFVQAGSSVGSSDLLPDTDNLYDIGSASLRWQDGFFAGSLQVDTNQTIGGSLTVTGDASATNLKLGLQASDPGTPTEGQVWYNSTDKVLKFFDGTSNIKLSESRIELTGQTIDTAVAVGDLVTYDFSNSVWKRCSSPREVQGIYEGSNTVVINGIAKISNTFSQHKELWVDSNTSYSLSEINNTDIRVGFVIDANNIFFFRDAQKDAEITGYTGSESYGVNAGGYNGAALSSMEYFDNKTSTTAATGGSIGLATFGLGGVKGIPYGYVGFGKDGGGVIRGEIYTYNFSILSNNAITYATSVNPRVNVMGVYGYEVNYGFFAGGSNAGNTAVYNVIEYIDITTNTGNVGNKGTLVTARKGGGTSFIDGSNIGFFAGGDNITSHLTSIEYLDIATTTGNAVAGGNLTVAKRFMGGVSGDTLGFFLGGHTSTGAIASIDYLDMTTSTNNAVAGGTISVAKYSLGSHTFKYAKRGFISDGQDDTPNYYTAIEYIDTTTGTNNTLSAGNMITAKSAGGSF